MSCLLQRFCLTNVCACLVCILFYPWSSYTLVCSEVSKIVPLFKYGLLHSYNLTDTLQSKGQAFHSLVSIYEVCNPVHANSVLSADLSISNALPCRISIWFDEKTAETKIQSVKPSLLIGLFKQDSLCSLAQQVEIDLYSIMLQLAWRFYSSHAPLTCLCSPFCKCVIWFVSSSERTE